MRKAKGHRIKVRRREVLDNPRKRTRYRASSARSPYAQPSMRREAFALPRQNLVPPSHLSSDTTSAPRRCWIRWPSKRGR